MASAAKAALILQQLGHFSRALPKTGDFRADSQVESFGVMDCEDDFLLIRLKTTAPC
jgi:hypothetical protein